MNYSYGGWGEIDLTILANSVAMTPTAEMGAIAAGDDHGPFAAMAVYGLISDGKAGEIGNSVIVLTRRGLAQLAANLDEIVATWDEPTRVRYRAEYDQHVVAARAAIAEVIKMRKDAGLS